MSGRDEPISQSFEGAAGEGTEAVAARRLSLSPIDLLAVLAAVAIWGTNFAVIPIALAKLPPLLLAALLGLSACGDSLSRSFGLAHDTPDEFAVTTRAPLSMPPDYMLRPPQPGASRPQEPTATAAAASALSPQAILQSTAPAGVTPGQQALLQAAGAPAPADIRNKVEADAKADYPGESFTDKLMFWREPIVPGVVIDPAREAERLKQDAATGQSNRAGATPIILPVHRSIFADWF